MPESIMPPYAFLADRELDAGDMSSHLRALYRVGVPYTEEAIEKANEDLQTQADPMASSEELEQRYPKAQVANFDGDTSKLTEMDALVAYLQMLGTLVDFKLYRADENLR